MLERTFEELDALYPHSSSRDSNPVFEHCLSLANHFKMRTHLNLDWHSTLLRYYKEQRNEEDQLSTVQNSTDNVYGVPDKWGNKTTGDATISYNMRLKRWRYVLAMGMCTTQVTWLLPRGVGAGRPWCDLWSPVWVIRDQQELAVRSSIMQSPIISLCPSQLPPHPSHTRNPPPSSPPIHIQLNLM